MSAQLFLVDTLYVNYLLQIPAFGHQQVCIFCVGSTAQSFHWISICIMYCRFGYSGYNATIWALLIVQILKLHMNMEFLRIEVALYVIYLIISNRLQIFLPPSIHSHRKSLSSDSTPLCSGNPRLESLSWDRPFWLKIFVFFLSLHRIISQIRSLSLSFASLLIIYSLNRLYIVWAADIILQYAINKLIKFELTC
jgi:hypothetical protein